MTRNVELPGCAASLSASWCTAARRESSECSAANLLGSQVGAEVAAERGSGMGVLDEFVSVWHVATRQVLQPGGLSGPGDFLFAYACCRRWRAQILARAALAELHTRWCSAMVLGMASLAACLVPQLGLTPLRAVGASTNRIARASAAGSGEGFGYGEGYDPELTAALELVEVSCRAAHHHHHSPHCHHHHHHHRSQHRPFAAASHASHSAPLAAALVGRWAAARPAICSPASSRRRARPPRQTPAARVSASRPSPSPTSPCSACCWALWRSASQMNAAWSELAVLAAAEPATPRLEALSRLRTAALLAAKAEPRPLGPRSAAALGGASPRRRSSRRLSRRIWACRTLTLGLLTLPLTLTLLQDDPS